MNVTSDDLKRAVARAARDYVAAHLPVGAPLGVGTGSTANYFIDELVSLKERIGGAIASSVATGKRLESHGLRVLELNDIDTLPMYVDGADEIDHGLSMIKGGGGALTREKIVAAVADVFVCICDQSKRVPTMGKFPLPLEVIPMARAQVTRELAKRGGRVLLREGFVTDNGNLILDVHGLTISDPRALESELDHIVGIVGSGLFARRGADVLLLADAIGITTYRRAAAPP